MLVIDEVGYIPFEPEAVLPYRWKWGIDAWALLSDYIEPESGPPARLHEIRRSLAWYMQRDANDNAKKLLLLYAALTVSVVAIGVETAAWTVALLTR